MNQFILNPDGSVPDGVDLDLLLQAGVQLVLPTPRPEAPVGFVAVEAEPAEVGGALRQQWSFEAVQEQPAEAVMEYTHVQFMDKFTDDELKGILVARKQSTDVELAWMKFEMADYIDIRDPKTMLNVHLLEYAQLIGQGRANQILELE